MSCERAERTISTAHAIHAIVDYYAFCRKEWPLSDVLLCAAAWYHVPEARMIHGVAVTWGNDGAAVGEAYWWIRVDGKDYDLLKMVQDRRSACHQQPQQQQTPTHELVDCSGPAQRAGWADNELFKQALLDVMDFKMPGCPACRGRHRAHACDDTCQSPWKSRLWALRESEKARPWDFERLMDRRLF